MSHLDLDLEGEGEIRNDTWTIKKWHGRLFEVGKRE